MIYEIFHYRESREKRACLGGGGVRELQLGTGDHLSRDGRRLISVGIPFTPCAGNEKPANVVSFLVMVDIRTVVV